MLEACLTYTECLEVVDFFALLDDSEKLAKLAIVKTPETDFEVAAESLNLIYFFKLDAE